MKYAKAKIKLKKYIIEFTQIIFGCGFMAFGTALFLLPNQLSSGGFAGISTIVYYLWKVPLGTFMFILNVPLLILSYFKVGRELVVKSVIGTAILSIFIDLLNKFPALTTDKFLACVYGGILMGIGTALILKSNASTGGTDLLSYLIKSYNPYAEQGKMIVIIDIIIVTLNVVFFRDIEVGLYSALAIYLMGKMIDIIFEGIYFTKVMLVISSKHQEIADKIGKEVNRGSTGIYSKGMYTNEDKMMLLCVGSRNEMSRMKTIAQQVDNRSFIVIFNAREALGKGFRKN